MIGIVATLKVHEGRGKEFEGAFLALAAKVRANEPGQDALDAHGRADHFRELGPKIGPCVVGRSDIEYLDAVDYSGRKARE